MRKCMYSGKWLILIVVNGLKMVNAILDSLDKVHAKA
jgi:hypothetical protein